MRSHRHRVDDHPASVVEMEHDHFQHVAGAVGSEDKGPQWRIVVAHVGDHERVSDGVQYIVDVHFMFGR